MNVRCTKMSFSCNNAHPTVYKHYKNKRDTPARLHGVSLFIIF